MRSARLILLTVCAVSLSTVAVAQQSADGPYILHEFFVAKPGAEDGGPGQAPPPMPLGAGQPPALSLEAQAGEPIYAKDGPVFDAPIDAPYGPLTPFGGANTLDDRTDRVDSLTYYANFDPSVIPYKRVVVQNKVVRRATGEYALEAGSGARVVVPQGSAHPADEIFWGSFLLRLEADRWHPIASVAPGQRLIDLKAEPEVGLEVYRDGADNYFVRSRQDGLVRVNMQLGASPFYFSGSFDKVAWQDFPRDEVPPMEAELVRTGLRVARQLGFDRQTKSPRETILEMIAYFRNFDARPFPEDLQRGDLFEAIATQQIGVCRHRSLAFVIMAQALGIPTRYVYNEAHAFVEVFWPTGGWRRVDLGGAANELNAASTSNRSMHDAGPDELPTPNRFIEEQQRMAHNGWDPGTPAGAEDAEEGRPNAAGTDSAAGGQGEVGQPGEASVKAGTEAGSENAANTEPTGNLAQELISPGTDAIDTEARLATRLRITDATATVRRGDEVVLQALLTDANGVPLAGREVEIYLGPVGSTQARAAQRLGTATTDSKGRVGTRVVIPREHSIGRWSMFLVFGGDDTYQPVVAE